ncbi:hypothetical protein [Roseibium alexandrii]
MDMQPLFVTHNFYLAGRYELMSSSPDMAGKIQRKALVPPEINPRSNSPHTIAFACSGQVLADDISLKFSGRSRITVTMAAQNANMSSFASLAAHYVIIRFYSLKLRPLRKDVKRRKVRSDAVM